jgi:hypothetical protein
MSRRRAFLSPIFVLAPVVVIGVGAPNTAAGATVASAQQISELRPLNLPREDISIGAQWQQTVGPVGKALPEDSLEKTRGVKESTLRSNTVFRSGIVAGLLQKLKLQASASGRAASTIIIDSATLVRVGDIDQLGSRAKSGTSFVWEGLKVHAFTFEDTLEREADLKASMPQGAQVASVDLGVGKSRRYSVKGADLYVAYRVVRLEPPTLGSVGRIDLRADQSSKDLGAEYTVTFVAVPSDTVCSGRLRVIDQSSAAARVINVPVLCGARSSGRYNLGVRPVAAGNARDELVYSELRRESKGGENGIRARVEINRRTYALLTEPNPQAPGW